MTKEQNEFKLVQILNKYFDDCLLEHLSKCADEIIQAGYHPIQADSEGLAIKKPCNTCDYRYIDNYGIGCEHTCVQYKEYSIALKSCKAQKAIDDKEKAEAVKKSRSCLWMVNEELCFGGNWEDAKAKIKQTLEELEEKK